MRNEDEKISIDKLIIDYFEGKFITQDYEFVIRGDELFIYDKKSRIKIFNAFCGEIVFDICKIFNVTPMEI